MANQIYAKAFQQMLSGGMNLVSGDIRVLLVDSQEYTPNLASHEFLSSVPSGGRVAASGAFTNKTVTDGVFDADDVTFTSVTGDQSEYLLIYLHTGSDATARLIALIDTATGLPATPGGGNITVTWSNGSDKIFALKNP
jgi:hypothetical protein